FRSLIHAPMADGGEGTLAALVDALGDRAERRTARAHDPLGREVDAEWLVLDEGRSAFVELASASGLARLDPKERSPANARAASTRGTGELVREALDAGAERITIGLGGSASTDGGAGLLAALGLRLLDADGRDLPDGGGGLMSLARAEPQGLDPRLREVGLTERLAVADLVITGEGSADEQTLSGKAALGVARLAPKATPVVLLCGALGSGAGTLEASNAFALVQPIPDHPMDLAEAMADS